MTAANTIPHEVATTEATLVPAQIAPPVETRRARSRGRQRHRNGSRGRSKSGVRRPSPSPSTADEHPTHTLFPDTPVSLSQLQGSFQLIASSAPMWRARRSVKAHFQAPHEATAKGSGSGPSAAHAHGSALQATWSFYELASFQSKTLLQRIQESRRARKARRDGIVTDSDRRPGEQQESMTGLIHEGSGKDHDSFFYTPQSLTFQKALGKKVKWEVIGYGPATDFVASTDSTVSRDVDWFVAYVHPLPLMHPFLSLYIRQDLALEQPNAAKILYQDLVDELGGLDLVVSDEHEREEGKNSQGDDGGDDAAARARERDNKVALQFELRRLASGLQLVRGVV